ncbi:paraquat-inducible protein A [Methylophilus rhizosphaerae]|uniref:Paraquat-inducible protein A n=1 Tax=Methylophilus rhizosphaerae TaxID=492660 RepID=A0A1G9B7M2_9PROT|nr:paraquat-inducible protein A [Methylophilus rhizosphaerae]
MTTTRQKIKWRRLRACSACDMVSAIPVLRPGEHASCPQCGHVLARRHLHPVQRSIALATSALLSLLIAIAFPFISMDTNGLDTQIELPQTAVTLVDVQQPMVALIVSCTAIILPALYLIGVMIMQANVLRTVPRAYSDVIARLFSHLHPWMMADVFIIAALVSLVKLTEIGEVQLGVSFWAYCVFAALLLMTTRSVDIDWLWLRLAGEPAADTRIRCGISAAAQHVTGCTTCGLVNTLPTIAGAAAVCKRCGSKLHMRKPNSLEFTWALLFTAVILYIPANAYPMMITTSLGQTHASTIIGGMLELWQHGSEPIAVVIFVASVLVPIIKMLILILLSWLVKHPGPLNAQQKTRLYHLTELIGRWSMVDVFVVAIMVALIQSGNLMSVLPGPAALAFCAVVITTMLAAMALDPRLLWDTQGNTHD